MAAPYLISENNAALGSKTLTLTVATATSAGDVIHVSANTSSTGQTVSGVVDSKGNTYAVVTSDTSQTSTYQFETTNTPTTPLVAGSSPDTITITYSGTTGAKAGVAVGIPGVTSGHDVAPAAVAGSGATSSSIASGTLGQAAEILIAVLAVGTQATAPTWGASWTQVGETRQASNPYLTVAYQQVNATTSVNATASWTASVKYCTLLTSYKIPATPPPSGMYLVGQASQNSGGSTTLTVPVTTENSLGDTITVGALAAAGTVTGVTDSIGNSYSLVQSETGTAGAALYVFEAYNTDPIPTTGGAGGSLVGCTVSTGCYPGTEGDTRQHSATQFDSYFTGAPGGAQTPAQAAQKIYYQNSVHGGGGLGVYPTSLVDGGNFDVTSLVTAGCQMWLCYQPYVGSNPTTIASELTAFQASVQYWLNNHPNGANGIRVIIYQEPQNGGTGGWVFNSGTPAQNAAAYVQIVKNYANGIRGLTDPHGNNAKVVYDAAGHSPSEWTTYYAGNAYIDEITVDYYANTYTAQSVGNTDPLAVIRNLAVNNNKPFAVTEMGSAIAPATATNQEVIKYFQYITTMMSALTPSQRTACMWYDGNRNTPNINTIGYDYTTSTYISNDYRIPYLEALYTALSSTTTAGTISVTYSTNTGGMAAIAVGDEGVQSGDDIHTGATGTGTTASVATGTLTQVGEHIIAFFADLNAGGAVTLGDNLSAASLGLSAGTSGPRIKAGFKAVSVTTTDTPSATLVSAGWAVSVVTHKVNFPSITSAPGNATVGVPFSWTGTSTGGSGTITWSETGTLPAGLTLTSAGVLSGTPTTAASYPYILTITDSLGLTSSLNVTQVVTANTPPPVTGTAPATPLPGNILSLADSDSETGTGWTWQALENASGPTRITTSYVTGAQATAWQALANGETQISTGLYAVAGGEPYVCSGYLLTNASLPADVGVAWYDATQTLISLQQGSLGTTVAGGWTPLSFALASPANAAYAALVVTAEGAVTGQQFAIDLMYLANSDIQILIDWNNPTFMVGGAAGQMFMDVTPFTRFDQNISYSRGRQDAISQVQPGTANFQLQNDLGSFTRASTISLPASIGGTVTLQRRAQLNVADETATFWTRFDGPIAQITYGYDNTGTTSVANVTLTDVLANLNRQDPLFCWTKEQVFADGCIYHWSLDDPGNTGGTRPAGSGAYGTAAETSGSNGPPMRLSDTDSAKTATIAWQSTSGGVETLADAAAANQLDGSEYWSAGSNQPSNPLRGLDSGQVGPFTTPIGSIYLTPAGLATTPWPAGSQTSQNTFVGTNGYYLSAELPTALSTVNAAQSYAFEVYFTMDPSIAANMSKFYGPFIQLSMGSARQKSCIMAGVYLNSGSLSYTVSNYNQPPAFLGLNWSGVAPPAPVSSTGVALTPDTMLRPHHLVLNVTGGSPGSLSAYLDGNLVGTIALTAGQAFDTICVGAAYGGAGAHFGGLQLASIYPYALSQQQINLHCQLGQYGMWESPSDDALTQVASYATVPAFWNGLSAQHNGLSLMEYMDITGSNALNAMQLIAQAENGLLFVNAGGTLNFHTRDWRMGYGAPDLVLPPGVFDAAMGDQLIDQFMQNEAGVAGPNTAGATATNPPLVSSATGSVVQPTNTQSSSTIQAGYINVASQAQYGVYAANPVSSPISLPLITWSRAYAQLGIPSLSFWPDPNLIDVAAWSANSRANPWGFPATLSLDLLTLDATITVTDSQGDVIQRPMGISDFYQLEIDNMVVPNGVLPQSFPNVAGALEWFIEGISETINVSSRTMTLYVSPAASQRAWIPGDATYGILGSTTMVGVSQSDLSTPQALGKDVSHDAGPPYWPPTFSRSMNNPDGSGNAFVGANDLRGITASLQLVLQPPMCAVSQISQTQSFTNGSLTNPSVQWDTINVDTTGGMGLIPGWPNWYVCTVPGYYELSGSVVWSVTGTGLAGYCGQAWFAIASKAAQALGAGTGTPLTVGSYVCPVGGAARFNSSSMNPVSQATTRVYLGLGDMVALCAEQNYTAARGTSTSPVGTQMSLRFVGLGTTSDQTEYNSALNNGGTVTLANPTATSTAVYNNTHTFSYQGKAGFNPFARRNSDLACFQGLNGVGNSEGSESAQIQFNAALINSQLTGHTITSATLTCANLTTWFKTGSKLVLGYTTSTPGGSSFNASGNNTTPNVMHQAFTTGQQLTFAIPTSIVKQFVTGGATALVLGDSRTTDLNYFGTWAGGPDTWVLTVKYK